MKINVPLQVWFNNAFSEKYCDKKKELQLTVEVPANIFRPSADKLTDVTAPSCSMKHFRIALINKSFIYIHDFKEKKNGFFQNQALQSQRYKASHISNIYNNEYICCPNYTEIANIYLKMDFITPMKPCSLSHSF